MNKKIFEGETNPIFSFISNPTVAINQDELPESQSVRPLEPETIGLQKSVVKRKASGKTRRLNLLIPPELHERMAKIACIKQISVNGVLVVAVKEYCAKEARALEKYERTFGAEAEEV